MADHRKRWFTQIIQSALSEDLVGARMILAHVTPEVMANHLPPVLMSEILSKSLSAGAMRPELVLVTLNPELLAEHIPPEILWACIAEAGTEAGMDEADGGAVGPLRRFLEAAIASGLDYGMVDEEEVLAELTPEVLARHMPVGLKAELLRACFEAETVNPELVVRTLGVANLAEHSPIPELWRIVSAAGRRAAGADDGHGYGAKASDKLFSIPEVKPAQNPKRATDSAASSFDDITRNAVPADSLEVDLDAPIAVDPPDDDRRKPNRRITGAGATSRRRAARASGKGASHRSPTELGEGEIEVVDETDVLMTPPGSGTK